MIVSRRSFLEFNLKFTGGATSGISCLSSMGAACEINSPQTDLGGTQVEVIQNYNTQISVQYKRLPTTNQNLLAQTELYNNGAQLTNSAGAYLYGRDIYHPLHTGLLEPYISTLSYTTWYMPLTKLI